MRDISKKLTIINTGERKEKTSGTSTTQTASYGGGGGGVAIGGGLYLPKATWDKVFEIKSTSSGEEYLFGKLPIALQYGLTMYVDGEMIELHSLATRVNDFLEGSDTDNIINKWKELESFLSGLSESDNLATILGTKADKNYVDKTFVTIQGNEDVTGVHSFVNGLKVGDIELKKSKDDVVYLDGNLVVKGGVTMYGSESVDTPSIYDGLPVDGTTIYWEYDDEGNKTVLKAQKTDIPSTVDDKTFFYEQQTAASIWNVVHNMGKRPSVMVFDSANDEVHGDIFYNDDNRVTLTFSSSFSGVAILN